VKLLRLKISDPNGFRSLQAGFEHHFRTEWALQQDDGFAPVVCAGPNGSGKSNLLEALAAIFFQLEVLRVRRSFLPESFLFDEEDNPHGFKDGDGSPNGFELEYLIRVPDEFRTPESPVFAKVKIVKELGRSPQLIWLNQTDFKSDNPDAISERERDFLLPEYVLGYSSGENEILSLPFFKMRFIQACLFSRCALSSLMNTGTRCRTNFPIRADRKPGWPIWTAVLARQFCSVTCCFRTMIP